MPNQFNHDTVQQYGGVAWARQQVGRLDPVAIDAQVEGYEQVKTSLNQIIEGLKSAHATIRSAWSGDAATAASQTFTDASNHAHGVVSTVDKTITQLKNASTAAVVARDAMAKVPDEKPVPSGGLLANISNAVSDVFTGTDPKQQAEQHNTAARTQAADVLNKLSDSYDNAANNLNSIAGVGGSVGRARPPAKPSAYDFGSGSFGGGSGAARGYSLGVPGGVGATAHSTPLGGVIANGVFDDSHTSLQGVSMQPSPQTSPLIDNPSTATSATATTPGLFFNGVGAGCADPASGTSRLNPPAEEVPGSGGEVVGEEAGRPGGGSRLGSSNVFGEDGFESETGTGEPPRRLADPAAADEGAGFGADWRGGSVVGAETDGELQPGMRGASASQGVGGGEVSEEPGPSSYARGRFFGGDEPGAAVGNWIQPSVGGNESLLVRGTENGSGVGQVASAYDGATDAEGNPLNMMGSAGGRRDGFRDDDGNERGDRPGYLKEDPDWWQSAGRTSPPVVE
jgi:uncharacterized protein YukE